MRTSHPTSMSELLIDRHGPLLGGITLAKTIGLPSLDALYQARRRGRLGIQTFKIDGRRGYFALTSDVADWLSAQSGKPNDVEGGST